MKKKEELAQTKEKLRLMYAVGMNHFCTHIGVTPLRGAYLPQSNPAEHKLSQVEPKIVNVHEEAYEKLNFAYLDDEDEQSEAAQSTGRDQASSVHRGEEARESQTTTLKTDMSHEEEDMQDQQNEMEDDYDELPGHGEEGLSEAEGADGLLEPELGDGASAPGKFSAMGESMNEGMGSGLVSLPSNANKVSETGAFVNAQPAE